MRSFLMRTARVLVAQGLAVAPDVINWIAGTALPVIPPPWNLVVGAILNGLGKAARAYAGSQGRDWKWVPV